MTSIEQPACIWLTRLAITKGIAHSRTTSTVTSRGVRIEVFLYSRMLRDKVLTIEFMPRVLLLTYLHLFLREHFGCELIRAGALGAGCVQVPDHGGQRLFE